MQKDEIVKYVEDYAKSFDAPVKEGVEVYRVRQSDAAEVFEITSSLGDHTAGQVVIAAGGYHRPNVPRSAERLPASIMQLHSSEYRNAESLPEGAVLVVGTGQSGCQIAEDLHFVGRQVHLAVGNAPRSPRLYRGKDVVAWLEEMAITIYRSMNIPRKTPFEPRRTTMSPAATEGARSTCGSCLWRACGSTAGLMTSATAISNSETT